MGEKRVVKLRVPNEKKELLKINDRLSKIIIPKEKVNLFLDWYEQDLYKENTVPKVFDEGYLSVDLSDFIRVRTLSIFEVKNEKTLKTQRELVNSLIETYGKAIVYYRVINEKNMSLSIYSEKNKELLCNRDVETELWSNTMKTKTLLSEGHCCAREKDLLFDVAKVVKATGRRKR